MKFQQWPIRDPDKNYFKVPNEVFHIGLSYPEISIYCYLLSIEDRETYQCYPSYKTIGKALGMSENTVSKYVRSLEEKGLIRTEPTMVRSKDGRPLNGNLLYTIRPIQAHRPPEGGGTPRRIGPRKPPERPVCAFRRGRESQYQSGAGGPNWPAFGGASGDERKSRINDGVASAPCRKHFCPQCGQLRGLLRGLEMGSKSGQ